MELARARISGGTCGNSQNPMGGSSGDFFAMGESLTEQCRVEVEGPRVVNSFF